MALPTAHDVLRGLDLAGQLALVTGGYSGLGLASTVALASAGAHVLVPARRPAVARRALAGVPGSVEVDALDLADLDSVRGFAERLLASGRRVDMLIANAAVMACPLTRVGPGWEAQFAINHLGHYALVNLVWPALAREPGARVVVVASGTRPVAQINWADPQFTEGYDKWRAYAQAKSANVLFASHLDRLARGHGARASSVSPGYILTPLQRHLSRAEMVAAGWVNERGEAVDPQFRSPEQGAATQVWAAVTPELGGAHCADCAVVPDVTPDPAQAARLWAYSAELTGIDAFAGEPHPAAGRS
jgi:NAD(P)-dependent dehydrogenase (short-subunit alcohol dehydrogenase family)